MDIFQAPWRNRKRAGKEGSYLEIEKASIAFTPVQKEETLWVRISPSSHQNYSFNNSGVENETQAK